MFADNSGNASLVTANPETGLWRVKIMSFRIGALDAWTNSLFRCLQSSSTSRFRHTQRSALHMVAQQANLPSYRLRPSCFLFGQRHDFSPLRHFVKCGVCGTPLTGGMNKGKLNTTRTTGVGTPSAEPSKYRSPCLNPSSSSISKPCDRTQRPSPSSLPLQPMCGHEGGAIRVWRPGNSQPA